MVIVDNNPNMVSYIFLIIGIGILIANLAGIIYDEIRLKELNHMKGLIIENHKKFQRKHNL